MSALDQPLLIANSNYHVGHQIAVFVAKERGLFREEKVEAFDYDPVFGYRNSPAHAEMLRAGKVDALTSQPPFSDALERDGYPMILDPNNIFPRRPGKITVATGKTVERRGAELTAWLRAIIRS